MKEILKPLKPQLIPPRSHKTSKKPVRGHQLAQQEKNTEEEVTHDNSVVSMEMCLHDLKIQRETFLKNPQISPKICFYARLRWI